MAALKALKAFFAEVKEEFEAGWQFVKFILRELWWAAVLAAVFFTTVKEALEERRTL